MRARAALLGVLVSLLLAAPAGAVFTPPELFVRAQLGGIEHQPASDWIPLSAAPTFNYIGGFQIGYRLQATGVNGNFQTAALTILGVPDGQPTQPTNTPPYCVGKNGTAGEITPVGSSQSAHAATTAATGSLTAPTPSPRLPRWGVSAVHGGSAAPGRAAPAALRCRGSRRAARAARADECCPSVRG
jgi:hypothetical protein